MSRRVAPIAGERITGETQKSIIACNDYLRMGPGRSLAKLCDRYRTDAELPPTRRLKTLKDWSRKYGWQARADAYDADVEHAKNERRREVMETGLALDYERILELVRLANLLTGELYKRDQRKKLINLWLADVKQIGSGDNAERVDLRRFNAAIVAELRGVLDDLAKETGGRIGKHEFTGKDGGDIIIKVSGGDNI